MTAASRPAGLPTSSLVISAALHATLVALALWGARGAMVAAPPVYKVDLVAAPAGPRAVGQVQPTEAPAAPKDAPVPKSAADNAGEKVPVKAPPARRPAPKAATQVPNAVSAKAATTAPKAGGGREGGQGTDVANVHSDGIAFPFPAYLNNIANQLILRFERGSLPALTCDVSFRILRDGTVAGIEIRKSSGSKLFDIEARGAVEAAGRSRAFGPLPDGFGDDVLPVIFTFTPEMIR